MKEKNQKKNYEKVMEGKRRDFFNEVFLDWTTTKKAREVLKSKRYATANKYMNEFNEKNVKYIEIEDRPFVTSNNRTLPSVTQIIGTINPYLDYLKDKNVPTSNDFINTLKILFKDKSLRKSIINRGGNIVDGINYLIQLSLITYPFNTSEKPILRIICLYYITKIKRDKSRYRELLTEFSKLLINNQKLSDDEKFYLYITLLNGLCFECNLFGKNILQNYEKIIPLIKDFKMCNITPIKGIEVENIFQQIHNKFLEELEKSEGIKARGLYEFVLKYYKNPNIINMDIEQLKKVKV